MLGEVRDGLMDGKPEVPALTGDVDSGQAFQDQPLDLTVKLALSDLLPDANGDAGVSPAHMTAGGIEVGGMQFWVFEDGTRLYYATGLSISVNHDG
jgi:hypothetical protein